jgi:hypothetical protein
MAIMQMTPDCHEPLEFAGNPGLGQGAVHRLQFLGVEDDRPTIFGPPLSKKRGRSLDLGFVYYQSTFGAGLSTWKFVGSIGIF